MGDGTRADDGAGWPRTAVFGAGAVGCYFGAKLALAGAPVTLIGRPAHVDAVRERGLWLDSAGRRTAVRLQADVSPEPVRDAQLVLLCVKSSDTAEAARAIAPRLAAGATVVSMQNGVDNVERARAAAPALDPVAAVVYVGRVDGQARPRGPRRPRRPGDRRLPRRRGPAEAARARPRGRGLRAGRRALPRGRRTCAPSCGPSW